MDVLGPDCASTRAYAATLTMPNSSFLSKTIIFFPLLGRIDLPILTRNPVQPHSEATLQIEKPQLHVFNSSTLLSNF